MKPDDLKAAAEIVYQYGPFAFALLFLYSISRWTYKKYDEASTRKDPPASPAQIRSTRWIYCVSFAAGLLLVAVSVTWWFVHRPMYVFSGVIKNLDHNTFIYSDTLYLRERDRPSLGENDLPLHDEEFVTISEHPFARGHKFMIDFRKNNEKRDVINIEYDPDDTEPIFIPDLQDGKNILVRQSKPSRSTVGGWFKRLVVYAQVQVSPQQPTTRIMRPPRAPMTSVGQVGIQRQRALATLSVDPSLTDSLQDPRATVGTRIVALEKLNGLDSATLGNYLFASGQREPLAATVLDLTRHSDKELAYEASRVMEKANLDQQIREGLVSKDKDRLKNAQLVLSHEDPQRASALLAQLRQSSSETRVQFQSLALVPTNFPEGDRYYMEVKWEKDNRGQVQCLAQFFANSLDVAGTPEAETRVMRGRNQRLVYSIYKDWVISAAESMRRCGATVSFVGPKPSSSS